MMLGFGLLAAGFTGENVTPIRRWLAPFRSKRVPLGASPVRTMNHEKSQLSRRKTGFAKYPLGEANSIP